MTQPTDLALLGLSTDEQARFRAALEAVLARLSSAHSRRAYSSDWRSWIAWLDRRGTPVFAVTPRDVQLYLEALAAEGDAGKTIGRRLTTLRQVYAQLVVQGLVASNPAREVKPPRVDRVAHTPWLSEAELARLLAANDGPTWQERRDRLMLLILAGCGLRRAEVASLRASHFDRREDGRWLLVTSTKGGKTLRAALPAAVAEPLEAWLEGREHLGSNAGLWTRDGDRVSGDVVYQVVARAAQRAGLERAISPHALRRTLATLASLAGADLRTIQAALGHTRSSTTEGYVRAIGLPGQAAGDVLSDVLRKGR